jgi:hypothetical protein
MPELKAAAAGETAAFAGRSSSGASRVRTGDLLLAKQALSQLSYGPADLV